MSGIDADIIAEVYVRGLNEHDGDSALAFDRVNSFIAGGMASLIDGDLAEAVKAPTGDLKDACWKGYTAVGMKMKNGRKVPNCVPKEEAMDEATKQQKAAGAALATQRGEYAGGKKGGAINRMSLMKTKDLVKIARGKKTNEEVEQVDEISSAMLYRAKQAAQKKTGWLMPGDKGKGDKAWNRVKKFRDAGVAKEKKERAKKNVNESFAEQMSTHKGTSLSHRAKRVKSFHAWEPPAVKSEANRVADVKMVKVKLPDGRVVFRRERPKAEVQMEVKAVQKSHPHFTNQASHTHPTGKTPYADMTNKELRADLTKKVKDAAEAYTGSEPTSSNKNDPSNRFVGTDAIRKNYAAATPGQTVAEKHLNDIKRELAGIRESRELNESFSAGFELAPFARDYGMRVQSSFQHHPEVQEAIDAQEDEMNEAIYQGRNVSLNKPMKGDVKKSKVYVRDPSTGNIKKVNFGDKTLSIKKDQPGRKRSYCARSGGQGNLTKKTSANYWSRRAWDC
jgi:ribosomal protein L34E